MSCFTVDVSQATEGFQIWQQWYYQLRFTPNVQGCCFKACGECTPLRGCIMIGHWFLYVFTLFLHCLFPTSPIHVFTQGDVLEHEISLTINDIFGPVMCTPISVQGKLTTKEQGKWLKRICKRSHFLVPETVQLGSSHVELTLAEETCKRALTGVSKDALLCNTMQHKKQRGCNAITTLHNTKQR